VDQITNKTKFSQKDSLTKLNRMSYNKLLVLRTLWQKRVATNNNLARIIKVERTTVVHIIKNLLELELIIPAEKSSSTPNGGRKAIKYSINKKFCRVLGIEIQPEFFRSVLLDLKGNIVWKYELKIKGTKNFEMLFFQVIKEIEEKICKDSPIIGISVGLPGWIDTKNNFVNYSVLHKLKKYDFHKKISSKFDIPIMIENDANCCGWGEISNNKKKTANFLYILGEFHKNKMNESRIGIGLGVVLNGKIYYGSDFSAGSFKSVFWSKSKDHQFGLSNQKMANLGRNEELQRDFLRELLQNISVLIPVLNPSHIYFGGDLKKFEKMIFSILKEDLNNNYIGSNECTTKMKISKLDDYGVAFGAAWMFLEELFEISYLNGHYKIGTHWPNVFQTLKNSISKDSLHFELSKKIKKGE